MPRLTPDEGLALCCAFVLAVLGMMLIIAPLSDRGEDVGDCLCVAAGLAVTTVVLSIARRRKHPGR